MENKEQYFGWLSNWLQKYLSIEEDQIDEETVFAELGIDSVGAVTLVGDLESEFNAHIDETLLWDYPTVGELVDFIQNTFGKKE